MGYGGIDFENVDADKIKEQYEQLKAEREEKEEREANKGTLDRINDTISGIIDGTAIRNAMGETYGNGYDMNPTTYRPLGKIEDIAGDVVDAVQTHTQHRQEFLHNAADMQEKAMNGQLTEEDIDNLRQSGRNARVSLANIAAAPFRQAARNMIQNHAGDNTSPWQPLAQSLEKTDVAQEYFITPAEKAQKSREMEQALGLPAESTLADNDTYREALEMYNFKQKADTMEEVWERYPELQTIAKDDKEGAVLALHNIRDVKETRSVVDTFMSFLEKGNTELEYNNLQYKIMMGRASDEEKNRAADLKKQIDSSREMKAPGFFQDPLGSMAAGVAGSLPEMGQSVKEGLEGGGVALTLASVAAAVISGGSSVAATAGFAAIRAAVARALASQAGRNLIKTGVYSGMIHGMAAPESGQRYTEYKAMTKADGKTPLYTDDEARIYSLIGGYGNAAIEIANIGVIGKAVYPVATRVFAQSVEQIAKQSMGRETIKNLALGRMGDWFKLTASESGEEALQSVADDVLGNIALASKGEEGAHYKQYSAYDIVTRAGQSFIESLPASMGFATLGTGAGTITGAGRLVRARKRAADMERTLGRQQTQTMMGVMAVEQLQKAVEQGNLNKVAPDVQKKILKEQLANTDFARAYIDVEMAIQKENGREDLQKVAEAAGMSTDELEAAITVNGFIPVETETLAQAKVSPDLLDSVSFSENADSMARMRENSKTIVEDYKKNFEKMVEHQKALADTIIKNYLPENASTEQKETLRAIMLDNPNNPAQAWNKWRKTYNDELQQLIAPALDALKRGMGNAGIMEVEDEQGNKKTQRYTENDEWYRNFYKAFKRKPTAAELQEMAIAMTIGDSNAPKVAGWIPDSAEAQAEMEKNRPIIEGLKNNIELLDSIKSEAKKLTGVEMELTQGLSPEAFKVYRALSSWANKAGGKIARAGRISAILVARHADLFAEAIRKNTGTNYTAEDYIRQRLGFQLIAADGTINEDALKQLAGVQAYNANFEQYRKAQEMYDAGETMEDIYDRTGWLLGGDGNWRFEIPDNLDAINWQALKSMTPDDTKKGYLGDVYKNPRLYDAYPFLKDVPIHLVDMAGDTYGQVIGSVYRRIEINKNISDEEKNKTLIHEIQHMIQKVENFGRGGSPETVREQIKKEIESIKKNLAGIPHSDEYIKANDEFLSSLGANEEKRNESSKKIEDITAKMGEHAVEKTLALSNRQKNLEEILKSGDDYYLYYNLAGEQEARAAEERAGATTDYAEVERRYRELEEKLQKEVSRQSAKDQAGFKDFRHLDELKEVQDLTEEENDRYEKYLNELDKDLLKTYDQYKIADVVLDEARADYDQLQMPEPHNWEALVVFGGQEMGLAMRPDIDLDQEVDVLNLDEMNNDLIGKTDKEIIEYIKAMDSTPITTADFRAMVGVPLANGFNDKYGRNHIIGGTQAKFAENKETRNIVLSNFEKIISNAVVIETNPNRDIKPINQAEPRHRRRMQRRKNEVANYYRILLPVVAGGEVKTLAIVAEEWKGKVNLVPAETTLYEIFYTEKNPVSALATGPKAEHSVQNRVPVKLSIRDMLTGVKDSEGNLYLNEAGNPIETIVETLFQRAWHGTPYDFEKFDLGAIGTGEGQQIHGWGLYFAKDRKISEERYRKRLALDSNEVIIDGETYFYNQEGDFEKRGTGEVIEYGTPLRMAVGYFSTSEGKVKDAIESLQKDIKEATPKKLERWGETWNKAIDILENEGKNWAYKDVKGGKLFEVEIPDNDVLLDEQKPLSQQPEKVKEAIINILAEDIIIDSWASTKELIDEEIETLEYVQKKVIESKDLNATSVELIEDPIYEYGILSQESDKIFDLLSEGKRSQGLLLVKQLIAKLTNEKNKLPDRKADIEEKIKKDVEKKYRNTRGEKLYDMIAYSPREASEKLNAAGVKGITYEGYTDGRCFVIFDDKAIDIIEKYNQQANGAQDEVNGGITAKKQADGRRIISIMETADESTFMHEMAHAFLFDLEELAEIDEGYAKDLAAVNEWAQWHKGAAKEYKRTDWYKGFADIEQAIIDAEEHGDYARAEQKKAEWRQERFARAFESYLKEGNAPAPGLKSVFRMFKQFLQVIYKAFTGDGGKPSEAVRRVMDRMIATDEEIEIAAINDRYNDVMKAGGEKLFDEKQEDTMKRWLAEEKEIAKEKVLKIVMRDLEKKRQQEYADDLAAERERYRDELMQENIFLARNMYAETKNKEDVKMWFKTVEEFDALNATVPDMETLVAQHMQEYGEQLDKKMIDSAITQEEIDKAMNSSKYRSKIERYVLKGMERKKDLMNQINAKARAAMGAIENKLNGLPEDADLQMDKHSNPTIKEIMNEITKLRFASRWDNEDLNHIEAMMRASTQEEVRKALKDLKSRQRQEKQNEQDIEEATKGMEKLYRDLIKQAIANRPMSETCNVKYYKDKERTAERRKAQMAKVKNWEMAIHQQRQKLFYSMMVKQAQENKEARDKMVKDLQKKLNAKTVRIPKDERYWFNRILYIMKINPVNPKMPEGGVASLDKIFTEQQESFDNIYVPEMLMNIRDAGENFGDYNKMSLQDFRDAYEDLVRLYVVGRDKFNFKSIGGKSIEEVAKEIIYDITKLPGIMTLTRNVGPNQGGLNYVETLGNMGQAGHDAATAIQKYSLSQIKPENILEMLGEKAQKYIYGLLEKAAEKEAKLAEQNLRALQDICGMYTDEERRAWKDQQYDFLGTKGWKITKENVIMMAMNYGSEKNRQRLIGGLIIDGRKKKEVAAQEVQQAIEELFKNTMTAKDWEFVQKLWDHIGSYWHETAAVEEKLNGIALGKVEALPFTIQTADGKTATLKGGYMHIKYDFDKSTRAEEQEINDMAASISAGARRLGIGRGMVKSRSEHDIYREVDLHYDVIEQHLQDVIHNIAYRIPVRDIYRLLHYRNDNAGVNMENYMRETVGVEAYRELDAWLMDCWRQVNDSRNSAEKSVNKFLRWMRNNATMAMMGYRVKVALENIGNIPIAMNQIGGAKMLSAMFGFYRHQEENYQEVINRSAFMRTRAENLDRDLKNQPGVFRAENKLVETAKKHAYDMLVITDLMVAAPMWWQVYHESIFPKMKEIQKENEENIAKRMELQQKVDSIRAEIAGHHQGTADIDEHLKIRRYGRPDEIEALKDSEFAGLDDAELRAQWGQHQNEIRNLNKELFKTEQQLEQSMQLPVYTDAEMQEEAINRAVFAADKVIRDTMGSGRIIDQAGVQRSTSELVRLFTAFYSFFNAQWNLIYMSYMKSKYGSEGSGSITKWAPLAKTLMYNVFLSALLTSAVGFALGLKGDDKDEKEKTVMVDGKKEKVEIPGLERFLRVYAKECLSVSAGGLYGIRDITQLAGDYFFSGQNFGYKIGSVATRGFTETARAFDMLFRKGEKDAEIQAQQDKREKAHQEKLAKLKGKKRREYLQKWEEEQKYRKPPKRITYEEILSHGVSGLATVTAAKTGITTTLTDAITHTMMYMMDKDMRYDPAWKNIVWSVIFDKKPVEREIPKKPPTEPKNKKKKKSKQSEL